RRQVKMVIVAMRDEYGVDRGQRFERNAGIVDAPGTCEAYRRDTLGPDRVDQQIEPSSLQEEGPMPGEGAAAGFVVDGGGSWGGSGAWVGQMGVGWGQPAGKQIEEAARLRTVAIKKTRAIEVVR